MNQSSMFFGAVVLLCLSPAGGDAQTTAVDSLRRELHAANADTARIPLLISLAREYRTVDRDKALSLADSALTMAQATREPRWIGLAHMSLGSLQRATKEGDFGIQHQREAEIAFRSAGDSVQLGHATMELARCCATVGETDTALALFLDVRSFFNRLIGSSDPRVDFAAIKGFAEAYHFNWVALYYAGRHREGLDLLFEFVNKERKLRGITPSLCNAYNDIGITYRSLGNREKTIEYFTKGIKLAKSIDSWDDLQRFLSNLSYEYVVVGDYARGREYLLEALAIQRKPGVYLNPGTLPRLYADLGDLETKIGRYAPALDYYLKALRIFENSSTPHELADLELSISDLYYLQAEYPHAVRYVERARKNFEQIQNPLGISQTFDRLGKIAAAEGRFDDALGYYRQSIAKRSSAGDRAFNGLTFVEMGFLFLRMTERDEKLSFPGATSAVPRGLDESLLDSAAFYFAGGGDVRAGFGDGETRARSLFGLGHVEGLRGQWSAAFASYDRARAIADSVGSRRVLYETYEALAEASSRLDRPEEAYRYHRLYAAFKDSVLNEQSQKQQKEMQARYETDKKDHDIELLSRNNEINRLKVREQEQQLSMSNRALRERDLSAKADAARLELLEKDRELKEHQMQENTILMYGSLVIAVLALGLGAVFISRIRLRKELEKREAVLEERRRIGSEMHDDLGSTLSTIYLLCEVLKRRLSDAASLAEADKISGAVRESLERMSDIVWSLNPRNDRLENIVSHIRKYAVEYLENSPVGPSVSIEGAIPDVELTGEQRRNLFLAVKEALHNVVKHSGATRAAVTIAFPDHSMRLSICDNGRGFALDRLDGAGNGISNMRRRIADAGGEAAIETGEGTAVVFTVPLR